MKKNERYIVVIGGINIDLKAIVDGEFRIGNMNKGTTSISLGGVGWNIALNLSYLDIPVKLISALGKDGFGRDALKRAKEAKIDMDHTIISDKYASSTVMIISDSEKEAETGVKAINPLELITIDYLKEKASVIDEAAYCIVDASLPREVLEHLEDYHKKTVFFIDPASETESERLQHFIGKFEIVKPNQQEAETLSGVKIVDVTDAKKAGQKLIEKGVRHVFITLDDGGTVYCSEEEDLFIDVPTIDSISSTGAGDALISAMVYCFYHDREIEYSIKFSIAASVLTLKSENPVHPEFSENNIKETMKELGFLGN